MFGKKFGGIQNHDAFMSKHLFYILISLALLSSSCDKWYATDDVSHESYLPIFELEGGEFISVIRSDSAAFEDPGATATSGERELTVYPVGEVDLTRTGVYIIRYYAENADGLISYADRIVAVTHYDISNNDLSGKYADTQFDETESKVKKENAAGLYKCEEVLGYYNLSMPGRFVDIGESELVLLPGDGYLGRYAASQGSYTRSTLSWTVSLLDPPNDGIDIDVIWKKKE
jgi:hypothetical protein